MMYHLSKGDLSLNTCIYDAYLVIRTTCDYRDATLTKNHLIDLVTYLSHLPFHSYLYLSCLSLVLRSIIVLTETGINPLGVLDTLSSLKQSWRVGVASVLMIPKSYSNMCYRELGHLCPSGILRGISLSPTTCISTWMYHCLFIITSLIVQVGLVTLG